MQVTEYNHSSEAHEANVNLGQDSNDFVANYLEQNGISEIRIKTVSKGQVTPLANNSTEEVISKNRKVLIALKK